MYSGIGLETCILFAREGANVLMADISGPALIEAADKLGRLLPHITNKVDTKVCDVSKESDVAALIEYMDAAGGVDIMFNNAGIMHADDAGKWCLITMPTKADDIQTPLTHLRRSGISLKLSTSRESGSAASTP